MSEVVSSSRPEGYFRGFPKGFLLYLQAGNCAVTRDIIKHVHRPRCDSIFRVPAVRLAINMSAVKQLSLFNFVKQKCTEKQAKATEDPGPQNLLP